MHRAILIAAVGDDEEDAASGHGGEGFRDGSKSIPEMDGMGAVGTCLSGAMELREGDGRVQGTGDAVAVGGGDAIGCADEGAVDGVDGDVIVRLKRLVGEGHDGAPEGGLQIVGAATEIEQDGEIDGIVTFEAYVGGVKAWAGVEADVEPVEADGRKWRERSA